ncbi:hypothetical protein AB0E66_27910 [Streptomyces sp. NPDC033753]|uniref:hypothetical protein n=1 Tax=Streptomyces sp. NPDC033753 TaxID=3155128 RepID=UPI0033D74138
MQLPVVRRQRVRLPLEQLADLVLRAGALDIREQVADPKLSMCASSHSWPVIPVTEATGARSAAPGAVAPM